MLAVKGSATPCGQEEALVNELGFSGALLEVRR
jgi:hypothetical protein